MKPSDMPSADRFAHGTRARYVAGCRCGSCRTANTAYARTRAKARVYGRSNGLVDAEPARRHLVALSRAGIGRRAVSAAWDVGETSLCEIVQGKKTRLREQTAARILAVTPEAIADGALVDARPTWRFIRELLREGYTCARLAELLGYQGRALQFRPDRVRASTALRIKRLHAQLLATS